MIRAVAGVLSRAGVAPQQLIRRACSSESDKISRAIEKILSERPEMLEPAYVWPSIVRLGCPDRNDPEYCKWVEKLTPLIEQIAADNKAGRPVERGDLKNLLDLLT